MEHEPWEESLWGKEGPPSFSKESEEEKRAREEKMIKEQEFLEEEEGVMTIEPAEHPDTVEREDVGEAWKFLKGVYQEELDEKGEVTPEVVEANIDHAERVAENAHWIAKGEGLNEEKLVFAGICHDCGKLDCTMAGGINTFGHHETSAGLARAFLLKAGKSDELVQSVGDMIERHSFIPFIIDKNPKVPEPKTKEDFALRDADVLDQIDIWGLKKIVEIRQNPKSEFFKEDKGDFQKALTSALETRKNAIGLLVTPTAKKIANSYVKRSEKLLLRLGEQNVKTLEEFQKTFDDFVKG